MKKWLKEELGRTRMRRLVRAFARLRVEYGTHRLPEEVFSYLGQIYKPTDRIPEATVKRMLRYEEVKDMIDDEIRKIMLEEGITAQSILQKDKEIQEKALEAPKPDFSVAEKINRAHAKMLGIDKPQVTVKETRELSVDLNRLLEQETEMRRIDPAPLHLDKHEEEAIRYQGRSGGAES